MQTLARLLGSSIAKCDALVVCGGVGGEGSLLADLGFHSVTVSDFSDKALALCRSRDPRLTTLNLDAEQLAVPDASYDVVFVQDGLHELPRPALGFTEMLRVARRAVIVIEPHTGIVAHVLGTKWERHGEAVNWVFRWNRPLFEQVARSYLLDGPHRVKVVRLWDHNVVMGRVARLLGGGLVGLEAVKLAYRVLDAFRYLGNTMIGIVIKATD